MSKKKLDAIDELIKEFADQNDMTLRDAYRHIARGHVEDEIGKYMIQHALEQFGEMVEKVRKHSKKSRVDSTSPDNPLPVVKN